MNWTEHRQRVHTVVLAGGDGERLRAFTEKWLGHHVPKQYCTFVGTRSMLQHTLDRAARLAPLTRSVTVVARQHAGLAERQIDAARPTRLVHQPANCGTAAGLYLGLSEIRRRDPDALVAVFPADHFVHPEGAFIEVVEAAIRATSRLKGCLALVGARPDTAESDYGWIVPGRRIGSLGGKPIREVLGFVEKPSRERAASIVTAGGVWNTMVMAASVRTFWEIGRALVPGVISRLDPLAAAIGTPLEASALDDIYRDMPSRDFSSRVLERCVDRLIVLDLEDVTWSDWGRPERIQAALGTTGVTAPALPLRVPA